MTASPAKERALLEDCFDRLWPIMRSITGDGVRETHDILGELIPLERMEIPSGTKTFDWTVPKEWVFRDAYVIDPNGGRILDARHNTLHLVNYSEPFRGTLSRGELDDHLYSLPERPDAIPYVTSYYRPRWGFCLSQAQRNALPDGDYQVVVDTDLIDGSLTLSECVLPGESTDEVLLSTYTCHPSMANNELSGPLVAAALAKRIAAWPKRRLTYRFVFAPETIGAIAYLSKRGEHLKQSLVAGYIITCVGIPAPFTYQRSRRGNSLADKVALHALAEMGADHSVRDFAPTGSDERQYCSPGFNLPVGSLMQTPYHLYPEYHTSDDNKALISFDALQSSVDAYERICATLDADRYFETTVPHCEPNLGSRGLYPTLSGKGSLVENRNRALAALWLSNQSDGSNSLVDIAIKSGLPTALLADVAEACAEKGLLVPCPRRDG